MISKILNSKVIRSIGLYSILNLVNSAIPFLMLPVLTRYLSKAEYGVIDLFNNLSFIFLPIVGLNIVSAVVRFYFDKEEIDLPKFVSTAVLFTLIFTGVVVLSTCCVGVIVALDRQVLTIIILAFLYACFNQIIECLLSIYRAQERALYYGIFRISKTIFDFALSTFFIIAVVANWQSRVYVAVIVSLVFSLIAVILLIKEVKISLKFDVNYLILGLKYSAPLILHSVSGYLLSFSDRFILLKFLNIEAVGVYGVAYQVGMIMSFVGNSFNQAWMPFLFKKLKSIDKEQLSNLRKQNMMIIIGFLVLTALIYLFVPLIYRLFIGKEFAVSPLLVLVILISYCFNAIYKVYVNFLFFYKKTIRLSSYTVVSAIFNIILCWFFVPVFGLMGAAMATLVSFALLLLLVYIEYRNILKINSQNVFS